MSSRINLRRSDNALDPIPTLTRGELFTQLANLQLVVGLEDEFSVKQLLPIRFFDIGARYELGDIVVYDEGLYKCINVSGVDPAAVYTAKGKSAPAEPGSERSIGRSRGRGNPSVQGVFDPADWQAIDAQALYDLHVVTLWDKDRYYWTNDVIHYAGSVYAALVDGARDPALFPEDWKNIGASAVEDIIQEFERVLQEDVTIFNWSEDKDWAAGDVIYYMGDLYSALVDVAKGSPFDPTQWELIHHAVVYHDVLPPANATPGTLWWDPKSGETFIWYNDGDSAQWVSTLYGAPGALAPFNFPALPIEQDEYIPVTGLRYIWFDDPGVWRGDPDLFVKITGSTMTGALILRPEAPQSDYEAVHKLYVETRLQDFFTVNDAPPTPADGVDGQFWFVRE